MYNYKITIPVQGRKLLRYIETSREIVSLKQSPQGFGRTLKNKVTLINHFRYTTLDKRDCCNTAIEAVEDTSRHH